MATSLEEVEETVKATDLEEVKSREETLQKVTSRKGLLLFSQTSSKPSAADYLLDVNDLKKLAKENDSSAQYLLGQALYYGWFGCVIDKVKSMDYLCSAAREQKTPAGQCASAICLHRAMKDSKNTNPQQFTVWLTRSLESNYIPAMWEMALSIIKPMDHLLLSEHNFHSTSAYTSTTLTRVETDSAELLRAIDLLNELRRRISCLQ